MNSNGVAKVEFPSEDAARLAAVDYFARYREVMNAYRCAAGPHYHIGHAK